MPQILSILAGLINLASGASYFRQILKSESTPNPATWIIWVVVTIINTATYFLVVGRDFWISLIYIVSTLVIVSIFVTSLFRGRFTSLAKVDIVSLILAIIVGIIWKVTGDPLVANISLQIIMVISFYPTINGLLEKTAKERPIPWFLASLSYVVQITNLFISNITLWATVSPLVNLVGQGLIAAIAYSQTRKNS